MLGAFASGVLLWVIYGLWIGSLPIIVTNVATLALALALVGMKMKFG
jgi:MtN3 and saliva related transmembrane protein